MYKNISCERVLFQNFTLASILLLLLSMHITATSANMPDIVSDKRYKKL